MTPERLPECSFLRCLSFFAEEVFEKCLNFTPEYLYRKRAPDKGGYDNLYDETAGPGVDIGTKPVMCRE